MRLVRKLTLALFLSTCVVLAVYGWMRVRRSTEFLESDIRRDAHMIGRALRASVLEVGRQGGVEKAMDHIERANERERWVTIRWVWLDARRGARYGPHVDPRSLEQAIRGREVVRFGRSPEGEERLYTYVPVSFGSGSPAAIELSESLEPTKRYVQSSILLTVATTVSLAVVSGLVAMVLGFWFVGRPVRALVGQARRVGAGDLDGRLRLRQRDELGELADEMNLMCDRLSEANARIVSEGKARVDAVEQLRHADRLTTVGKLASGIAHEMGTPLNVVAGRANMIASREVEGDEIIANARMIGEEAERMTRIIRQLLDFARLRGPERASADVRRVVRRTLQLLLPLVEKRRIQIEMRGDESPCMAEIDDGQIQQALTNLVVNSLQALPDGGTLTIEVGRVRARPPADHPAEQQEWVRIAVRDEGVGIAPEDLPHVFEPFFTTKDVGQGTGLGLAVAYGLVREHGGWIDVESQEGRGSTFSIHLAPEATA